MKKVAAIVFCIIILLLIVAVWDSGDWQFYVGSMLNGVFGKCIWDGDLGR